MKFLKVLNMKKIVLSFLVAVMLGLSGCIKPVDQIKEFSYIPAFVDFSFTDVFGFVLRTPFGLVISNEIQNATDLNIGDAVLAFYTVNFDQQTLKEYTFAYDLDYVKVNRATAHAATEGESTGELDFPIAEMFIAGLFENCLFVIFGHKATEDQEFNYEMTFDNSVTSGIQELKIKAIKNNEGIGKEIDIAHSCAFDMRYFLYHSTDERTKYSIWYKTRMNNDGKNDYDIYFDNLDNTSIFQIELEE